MRMWRILTSGDQSMGSGMMSRRTISSEPDVKAWLAPSSRLTVMFTFNIEVLIASIGTSLKQDLFFFRVDFIFNPSRFRL
jgi:hypothetical protein